ncbi:MAG: hypothetical protein ABIH25_00330 [Candidatus Woesearchaeota archaeon]
MKKKLLFILIILIILPISGCKFSKLDIEKDNNLFLSFVNTELPEGYIPNSEVGGAGLEGDEWGYYSMLIAEDKNRNITNENTFYYAGIVATVLVFNKDNLYYQETEKVKKRGKVENLGDFEVWYNYSEINMMPPHSVEYYQNEGIPLIVPPNTIKKIIEYDKIYGNAYANFGCHGDLDAQLQPNCEVYAKKFFEHLEQYEGYFN